MTRMTTDIFPLIRDFAMHIIANSTNCWYKSFKKNETTDREKNT